jgi:hypothetical protein
MVRRGLLALVLAAVAAQPLLAQSRFRYLQRAPERWQLVVQGGAALGGPMRQMERAMRAQDMTDPIPCLLLRCDGDAESVEALRETGSAGLGGRYLVQLHYRRWKSMGVVASAGLSRFGGLQAYRLPTDLGNFGQTLFLEHGVGTVALSGTWGADRAWVQAGPALHRVYARRTDGVQATREEQDRIGALAGGGVSLRLPAPYSHLSVEGVAQYRYVPTTSFGPFLTGNRGFPATRLDYSHLYLGLGVGYRW